MDSALKSTPMTDAEAAEKLQAILADPKKKTTAVELLQIAYRGKWLAPNGDPDLLLDIPIRLGDFRETAPKEGYNVGTWTNVYPLNTELFFCDLAAGITPPLMHGVLPVDRKAQASLLGAHEGLHALQTVTDFLDRALYWDRKEPSIGHSARFGHGPSLEKNLERGEAPEERTARYDNLLKATRGESNVDVPEVYNLEGAEIQACLSQLISSNEKNWKKTPATADEVVSAFYGFLGAPHAYAGKALENEPAAAAAQDARNAAKYSHRDFPIALDDVATLEAGKQLRNQTVESLRPGQQDWFFSRDLPAFYGDLMEKRGDPKGLVNVGQKAGPVGARAFLWQMIIEANDPEAVPWSVEKWQRVGAKVEPFFNLRLQNIASYYGLSICQQALQPQPEAAAPARRFTLSKEEYQRVPAGVMAAQDLGRTMALNAA